MAIKENKGPVFRTTAGYYMVSYCVQDGGFSSTPKFGYVEFLIDRPFTATDFMGNVLGLLVAACQQPAEQITIISISKIA